MCPAFLHLNVDSSLTALQQNIDSLVSLLTENAHCSWLAYEKLCYCKLEGVNCIFIESRKYIVYLCFYLSRKKHFA